MSNTTIDAVEQCCPPSSEIPSFQFATRYVAVKLSYQYSGKRINELTVIKTSRDAEQCFRASFDPETIALQESFYIMALNKAGRVIAIVRTSTGSSTGTMCDLKIIFTILVVLNAQAVLICHNHPSGNLSASTADLNLTAKFKHASQLLDIELRDHIILSPDPGQFFSFADEGMV